MTFTQPSTVKIQKQNTVCESACVRACVRAWVGGWVGVCVLCLCVCGRARALPGGEGACEDVRGYSFERTSGQGVVTRQV